MTTLESNDPALEGEMSEIVQQLSLNEDADFAGQFKGLKKKKAGEKKKKDRSAGTAEDEELKEPIEDDAGDMEEQADPSIEGYGNKVYDNGLYPYSDLLTRIFQILRKQNPDLAGEKRKYTIVPPSVHREGNKKTLFSNIVEICKRMNRSPEHVIQYLFAELGTTGSTDANQQLIIRGRFQQKQIENVLKRYIVEYVTCKTCKSPNTVLKRESRLFFQQCESCGSTRSVSAIKSGFKAQTEKRSAQRNKEA
jgi:translation initiation factor 2 subunit 2